MDSYCGLNDSQTLEQKLQATRDSFKQKIELCTELQQMLSQEKQSRNLERDNFRQSLQDIEAQLDLVHADADKKQQDIERKYEEERASLVQ